MYFVGIAGRSGSGKSTLAYTLLDTHLERINLIHLDDFMLKTDEVDYYAGYPNFDEPAAIRFDDLVIAMQALCEGQPVTVRTKCERINPDYKEKGRIPYEIVPREVMLLEGFLVLHDQRVRSLLDFSFFLDLDEPSCLERRTKDIRQGYDELVLKPMQRIYVDPTRVHANAVIHVSGKSEKEVLEEAQRILREEGIL